MPCSHRRDAPHIEHQEVDVDALLIFLTSLGAAYLASRLTRRAPFTLADLACGLIGGLVGVSMAQILSAEGVGWGPSLPLILACAITLGIEALRPRSILP